MDAWFFYSARGTTGRYFGPSLDDRSSAVPRGRSLTFLCAGQPGALWASVSERSWCPTESGDHPTNSLRQGLTSGSESVCGPL